MKNNEDRTTTWTIGRRITIGFAISATITAALSAFLLWRVQAIQDDAQVIVKDCLPGVYYMGELKASVTAAEAHALQHIRVTDPTELADLERDINASRDRTTQIYAAYEKSIITAQDRVLFDRLQQMRPEYLRLRTEMLDLSRSGKKAEAASVADKKLDPVFDAYMEAVQELVDYNKHHADDYSTRISAAVRNAEFGALVGGSLSVIFAVAAAYLISRTTKNALVSVANAIGTGSDQVAAAAGQVSSSSQTLATGASEQAASLEETSASLEEMSSMTQRNADNAQQAKALSARTRTSAESGSRDMHAMSAAMADIKSSSDEIAKIIKTIDEIAFQTNILALNAAVEAARAGEAGLGFAVVADEVRNLAQRSANAAKETAEKIESAIRKTTQGVQITDQVGRSLNEIVEQVRKVDALIAEVTGATREQSEGVKQINQAVGQMDQVVQTNASAAEESAAAGEELNAQAIALLGAVRQLDALVGRRTLPARADVQVPAITGAKASAAAPARPAKRAAFPKLLPPPRSLLPKTTANGSNGHDKFFR